MAFESCLDTAEETAAWARFLIPWNRRWIDFNSASISLSLSTGRVFGLDGFAIYGTQT